MAETGAGKRGAKGTRAAGASETVRRRSRALSHIYARVAAGTALARVLEEDGALPRPATFWRWHMEDAAVREALSRARAAGVEALLDEALAIADGAVAPGGGGEGDATSAAAMSARVQRDKLRIDTRFRYAQLIAGRAGDDAGWSEAEGPDEVAALTRLAALADRLARRTEREPAAEAEAEEGAGRAERGPIGTGAGSPASAAPSPGAGEGRNGTVREGDPPPLALFARLDHGQGGHGHAAPHAG